MIENIITVIGLLLFVYLCYWIGRIITAFQQRRYAKAWQPLISVVNGTVHADQQGGASSYLGGTWQGVTIHARMTPSMTADGSGIKENHFAVGVPDQTGGSSWNTVTWPSLNFVSKDPELITRLRRSRIPSLLEDAQCRDVRFDRGSGTLWLHEIVTPLWVPPVERFGQLLDCAVAVAREQALINPR